MLEKKEGEQEIILALPSPKIPIYHLKKLEVGRPTIFTPQLAQKICYQLSLGKSLRMVCKEDPDLPVSSTIFKWLGENKEFSEQYALAKEASAEAMNEELMDLGDQAIELSQEVDPKASGAVVQAVRLKADNLKWYMSKMKPKKYGEKVDLTSGGEVIKGNTIMFNNFTLNAANSK